MYTLKEAICIVYIEGGDSRIERHCRVVPHIAKLQPLYHTPEYTCVRVCVCERESDGEGESARARTSVCVCVCVCVSSTTL